MALDMDYGIAVRTDCTARHSHTAHSGHFLLEPYVLHLAIGLRKAMWTRSLMS